MTTKKRRKTKDSADDERTPCGPVEVELRLARYFCQEENSGGLIEVFQGQKEGEVFPEFKRDFRMLVDDKCEDFFIVEVKNNTAEFITKRQVADAFFAATSQMAQEFKIGWRKCHDTLINVWASISRSRNKALAEWPIPVVFKDDDRLAFHRLEWNHTETDWNRLEEFAPTFAGIMERMVNHEAFCAMVGASLDSKADRKKAVWCYGPGDGGKSALVDLIEDLVGKGQALRMTEKAAASRFFASNLKGVRALLGIEQPPTWIYASSEFKSLTGEDKIMTDVKNQQARNVKLDCLVYCFSNFAPVIPNDDALLNRVVACYLAKIPDTQKRFAPHIVRRRLNRELEVIAGYCYSEYLKSLKRGLRIETDLLGDAVETHHEAEHAIVNQLFEMKPGGETPVGEVEEALKNAGIRTKAERDAIKDYIERQGFGSRQRHRDKGRYWQGFVCKPSRVLFSTGSYDRA